jgi:hypothetical protein
MSELEGPVEPRDEAIMPLLIVGNAALVMFVESVLRSADIPFFIAGDRLQDLFGWGRVGGLGFNLITGPPVLYVSSSQVEEVRALLEDANATHEFAGGTFGAVVLVSLYIGGGGALLEAVTTALGFVFDAFG